MSGSSNIPTRTMFLIVKRFISRTLNTNKLNLCLHDSLGLCCVKDQRSLHLAHRYITIVIICSDKFRRICLHSKSVINQQVSDNGSPPKCPGRFTV